MSDAAAARSLSRQELQLELAAAVGRHYEVLQHIGRGGMADVFLARSRSPQRFVAIKVLAVHKFDGEIREAAVAMFLQEAEIAAELQGHDNIVPVEKVQIRNGLPYLVMPYVEGEDLSKYLKRLGPLTWQQTAHLAAKVADALQWAHDRDFVHRDIKPSNIRIRRGGQVSVLDFGIAKAGAARSALTEIGQVGFTKGYAAPEQAAGAEVGPAADLYSLGVVSFELLTGGKPPADIEACRLLLRQAANGEIPNDMTELVLRLLAESPDERLAAFTSAGGLAKKLRDLEPHHAVSELQPRLTLDLDGWRSVEPTRHDEVSDPQRDQPTVAKGRSSASIEASRGDGATRRWLLGLGAGGALVTAGAAAFWSYRDAPESEPERPPAPTAPRSIRTSTGRMVLVPAGSYVVGSDAVPGNQRREIVLPAFFLDVAEVSNGAYRRFCDETGRPYPEPPFWGDGDRNYFEQQPHHPVVNVTFDDAWRFAAWAGKRLPTEAEWEAAARGTRDIRYPWGDEAPAADYANFGRDLDAPILLERADAYPDGASPFGALQMAGNVSEWTSTVVEPSADEREKYGPNLQDPNEPWRILKGGGFNDVPDDLTVSSRERWPSSMASPILGFRCIRDLSDQP